MRGVNRTGGGGEAIVYFLFRAAGFSLIYPRGVITQPIFYLESKKAVSTIIPKLNITANYQHQFIIRV